MAIPVAQIISMAQKGKEGENNQQGKDILNQKRDKKETKKQGEEDQTTIAGSLASEEPSRQKFAKWVLGSEIEA